MEKLDGRKLNPKTMEEIRIRAVHRVQEGESPETVIKALGIEIGQRHWATEKAFWKAGCMDLQNY